MIRSLCSWLRGVWIFPRRPAVPARKPRPVFPRGGCPRCGKVLAHTRDGRAWRHVCVDPAAPLRIVAADEPPQGAA